MPAVHQVPFQEIKENRDTYKTQCLALKVFTICDSTTLAKVKLCILSSFYKSRGKYRTKRFFSSKYLKLFSHKRNLFTVFSKMPFPASANMETFQNDDLTKFTQLSPCADLDNVQP